MVFRTSIAQIQGILQKVFFLTWFPTIVNYRFLTENYIFRAMCTTIRSSSV